MKVLIVGNGAREHALTWAISENPRCTKIYCSPGNAGTTELATNVDIDLTSNYEILQMCLLYSIDLVIVGPEKQFEQGLTDALKEKNILVFGPSMKASQLETSKSFTKHMCKIKKIPTGNYEIFSSDDDARLIFESKVAYTAVESRGKTGTDEVSPESIIMSRWFSHLEARAFRMVLKPGRPKI